MKKRLSVLAGGAAALFAAAVALTPATASAQLEWGAAPTDLAGSIPGPPFGPGNVQMNGTAIANVGGTDYLYIIGGNTAADGGDTNRIRYAPINAATGNVGPWAIATTTLGTAGVAYHTRSCITINGRIYVVGGRFNAGFTAYNGIRVFTPTTGGDITAPAVEYPGPTTGVTLDRLEMQVVAVPSQVNAANTLLYIIGGSSAGSGTGGQNVVQSVTVENATGNILGVGVGNDLTPAINATHPTLPGSRGSTQAVVHSGRIYLVGGNPATNTTVYAEILGTDTLGPWQTATGLLPGNRFDGGVASFGGNLYQIGGCVSGNADTQNTVFRATFGTAGDITGWTLETPASPLSNFRTPGVRRIGVTVGASRIFIVGGRLDAAAFATNVVVTPPPLSVNDWMNY